MSFEALRHRSDRACVRVNECGKCEEFARCALTTAYRCVRIVCVNTLFLSITPGARLLK